jgi:hypothetical protein
MSEPIIIINTPTTGSYSGIPNKAVQISNGCFARTFGETDWTRIRLAMRWRLTTRTGSAANVITPDFAVGFCNGTTNIPGTKYVQNFVGMKFSGNVVTFGTPIVFLYRTDYWYWSTRVSGSSWRNYAASNASVVNSEYLAQATSSISAIFFDVIRGPDSGSYSASFFRPLRNNSSGPTTNEDYTITNFLSDIEDVVPSEASYAQVTYVSKSFFIVDEPTYGNLDSVCVYWSKNDPVLQIEDLYVVRLA